MDNLIVNAQRYYDKVKERDRKEFLNLLIDDEVIKNNIALQEKYMELYDKYTSK